MAQILKIEKGIPLPNGDAQSVVGQLRAMEVGDSFLWPAKRDGLNPRFSLLKPKKFATRKAEGGFRVWRTA